MTHLGCIEATQTEKGVGGGGGALRDFRLAWEHSASLTILGRTLCGLFWGAHSRTMKAQETGRDREAEKGEEPRSMGLT